MGAPALPSGAASLVQPAGEAAGAVLERGDEVGVDWRLSGCVAARWFGSWLLWLGDPENLVQHAVGALAAGMLGHKEQDAALGGLEAGKQPPGAVQIEPADAGH